MIEREAAKVFAAMQPRVSVVDMSRIRDAFAWAREAHAGQWRKSGLPYILHPISVARIVAEELMLDADTVIAAFLHDVVEDTEISNDEIQRRFGDNVAFLVRVVTKQEKAAYDMSPQLDNFKQMLDSVHYDIRALLMKLADRLHNMRTLDSLSPSKQMKIAGETDCFYAPLANRLGLYNIKVELENLSLRYRCQHEYEEIERFIARDRETHSQRIDSFVAKAKDALWQAGIEAQVTLVYREPYSLWRKMRKTGEDLNHLTQRYYFEVVFACDKISCEKEAVLKIYSCLSSAFKEKPHGIINYIDAPKENGYQSFHVLLLSDYGCWEEVHISSERMVRNSQIGCVAQLSKGGVSQWINALRKVLQDMELHQQEGNYLENVVTTLYNDDIMVFTPNGKAISLPKSATALDFAFEIHRDIGSHAHFARINGKLSSIKTELHRGDVVQIETDPDIEPDSSWLDHVVTYKARRCLSSYFESKQPPRYHRCPVCNPIPGDEVVGFDDKSVGTTVHRRNCPEAILLASRQGDSIVDVDFQASHSVLYPVTIKVVAVDRQGLLSDMIECITAQLHLSMSGLQIETRDCIVTCVISFGVHSASDLNLIISHLLDIAGIEEVKKL